MPGRPLPRPRDHTLIPTTYDSFLFPWHTFPWPGAGNAIPTRGETCHILGILDGCDSPPPGPPSCPTWGGEQNWPRVQSDFWLAPVNPILGTPHIFLPKGKKSCIYRYPLGGGGVLIRYELPTLCLTRSWVASNPTARSISQPGQRTLWCSFTWCVIPSPIIRSP